MRPCVFVTRKLPEAALARLGEVCDVEVGAEDPALARAALLAGVRKADGLVCLLTDRIDREVIEAGHRLKVIANVAVGYNNVDVGAAQQRGIYVTNTPGVLTDATADLTWALILAVTRRVVEADAWVRTGNFKTWDFNLFPGFSLTGRKLGIIGYGRIGRAVARRATGFGVSVLYCGRNEIAFRDDPTRATSKASHRPGTTAQLPSPINDSTRTGSLQDGLSVRRTDFYDLLEQSDIVSLHVPMAAATKHLIDAAAFGHMKPTAFLINTARGEIMDEAALVEALGQGRIAGAGLDVYEHEPQVSPALMAMNNVVLLPHIGSATRETRAAMAMLAVENAIDALSGRPPRNAV
ncbi:MAG TPA: D-glycerate dehydrogenase [Blastocatellia bacterium]|nr:D-glycerate dehydrogenase [Blastocatellia bacterium]